MYGVQLLKVTKPLRVDSLGFTNKFPEFLSAHLVHLGRMKGNTYTILPPSSKEKGSCSNMQKGRIDTHHEFALCVEVDGWLEKF